MNGKGANQRTEPCIWTVVAMLFRSGWVDVNFLRRAGALKRHRATWADPDFRGLFLELEAASRQMMAAVPEGQIDGGCPYGPHYETNAEWAKLLIE